MRRADDILDIGDYLHHFLALFIRIPVLLRLAKDIAFCTTKPHSHIMQPHYHTCRGRDVPQGIVPLTADQRVGAQPA